MFYFSKYCRIVLINIEAISSYFISLLAFLKENATFVLRFKQKFRNMAATATLEIAAVAEKKYTVEEYFELERHSTLRHEFVNGKLYKMPGESRIANRIATNCTLRLGFLEDKGYDIIRHDVRTIVRARKNYRYPDLAVAKRSDDVDTHGVTKPE